MGYAVTFTVTDGTNAIEGATVSFNSADAVTDANGQFVISDVVDGSYDYTVAMDGYISATGSVTVSGADVAEAVTLTQISTVTITVVDGGGTAVAGASVTFDGQAMDSDANGQAIYTGVVDGSYEYSVSHPDYIATSGTITVAGADVNETATIELVLGFESELGFAISYYPNPVNNVLTVELGSEVDDFTLSIVNMNGAEVLRNEYTARKSAQLDLSAFENGMYLLRIQSGSAMSTYRIVKR